MPSCNHSTCLRDVNTFLSLLPNCFLRTALGMFLIIETQRDPVNMWFIAQVNEDSSLELMEINHSDVQYCTTGTAINCTTVNYFCHLFTEYKYNVFKYFFNQHHFNFFATVIGHESYFSLRDLNQCYYFDVHSSKIWNVLLFFTKI